MTLPVVREIHIDAAPETVFGFFVDPEKLCRWLAVEATLEPRPGGKCVQVHDTGDHWGTVQMLGTFVAVEPPHRVVFTWGFAEPEIGVPPGSSIVEVTLTAAGSGTHVRLEHRDLPEKEIGNHAAGWTGMLEKLARVSTDVLTIRQEVWLDAPRKTVFEALTTKAGLDGWWGPVLAAEPSVGSVVEFEHGLGKVLRMRIEELVADERVVWRCLTEFTDPRVPGYEWLGHEIRFELRSAEHEPAFSWLGPKLGLTGAPADVTVVDFRHSGWSKHSRWYGFCNAAWGDTLNTHLRKSLA